MDTSASNLKGGVILGKCLNCGKKTNKSMQAVGGEECCPPKYYCDDPECFYYANEHLLDGYGESSELSSESKGEISSTKI